jgi:hypothetical protein
MSCTAQKRAASASTGKSTSAAGQDEGRIQPAEPLGAGTGSASDIDHHVAVAHLPATKPKPGGLTWSASHVDDRHLPVVETHRERVPQICSPARPHPGKYVDRSTPEVSSLP